MNSIKNMGGSDSNFAVCLLAVVVGIIYFYLINVGVKIIYKPDIASILMQARLLVPLDIFAAMAPEPVERMQYQLSAFTVPVIMLLTIYVARYKCGNRLTVNNTSVVPLVTVLVSTIVLAIYSYISVKNSDFLYVRCSILYFKPVMYISLVYPLMFLLAWYDDNHVVKNINRLLLIMFAGSLLLTLFCINLFNHDTVPHTLHFNPVLYPLAQVVNGKQILHNWTGIYGLYPVFLEPVFRLVRLNVISFSMLMAILEVATVCFGFYFMRSFFNNRFILLVGLMATFYFGPLGLKTIIAPADKLADPYFQYMPLRMISPAFLLFMVANHQKQRDSRVLYWGTFLFCSLALLWNFESGFVVSVSWFLFLGYIEFFNNDVLTAAKKLLVHSAKACSVFIVVFLAFNLYQLARYGAVPDWSLFTKYQQFFYLFGYYMLEMPASPHVWNLLVLIFMIGMAVSVNGLFTRENETYNSNIFLLTLLSVGIFVYYQGRSHDYNIFPVLYMPVIIVCYMLDNIFHAVKSGTASGYKYIPLALFLFYFSASAVPSFAAKADKLLSWSMIGVGSLKGNAGSVNAKNIEFISKYTAKGEKVLVFIPGDLDGIYYAETGTVSAIDAPSFSDYFFNIDSGRLDDFVKNNVRYKVFAIPAQTPRYLETLTTKYFAMANEEGSGLTLYLPKGSLAK